MTADIGVVLCGPSRPEWPNSSVNHDRVMTYDNSDNANTPCQCYQKMLELTDADILVYMHADVTIHDADWLERLTALFENPKCVAAGFGGATSLGRPDLYKKRYDLWNMARGGYASNQDDAETHGERFTGTKRVAVLDAFTMAVRTSWLRSRGGWPVKHLSFHCMDTYLACEAARADMETWIAGVSVAHHGGGTSVTDRYKNAKWLQGDSLASDHEAPHFYLWDSYRDVLPITV